MIITRDLDYRRHLLDSQRASMGIGSRREGVHVSDLIMCVRKAWAERTSQHIPEISDQTVLTWLRGLSHEALLTDGVDQVRAGYCFTCQVNYQWSPELAKTYLCPVCGDTLMVGTIDWVTTVGIDEFGVVGEFIPVEMKSTLKSSRKTLEDGDMAWFMDQLKSYLYMHGEDTGRIAVLHVMGDYSRNSPDVRSDGPQAELRVYQIAWENDAERDAWGSELALSKTTYEGPVMPPLDLRSPRHPMICEYCVIGELLPDGTQCLNFPWTPEGVRKGSKLAKKYTMDEIEAELGELGVKYQ